MPANKSPTLSKLCSLLPPKLRSMSSYRSTMLEMGSILPAAGMEETQVEQTAEHIHSRSCRCAPSCQLQEPCRQGRQLAFMALRCPLHLARRVFSLLQQTKTTPRSKILQIQWG